MGIVGGFVGPPIREERAEHMTDEQWVGAMRKHASDEGDQRTFELRGGAYELGHVLKAATEREPERLRMHGPPEDLLDDWGSCEFLSSFRQKATCVRIRLRS